jgi:hypothetical protein
MGFSALAQNLNSSEHHSNLLFCITAHDSALAHDQARRQPMYKAKRPTPMRHSVDYLYSLYDALVSINVPNDKARAVVDAMERDMGTTIATKADLQMLRQELKSDIAELRHEVRQDIALVRKDMELLSTTMTVRLGSMLMVGLGLLFAALKLT